jgi:hypothetical protein
MNSILKNTLIVLSSLALATSIIWAFVKPDYEPIISSIVCAVSLIGLWISDTHKQKSNIQNQVGGNNSKNYQAGKNIKIQK